MPKTGSNLYKRKDGRWEGRYPKGRRESGAIVYGYVYAKTCAEAKKRLGSVPKETLKRALSAGNVLEVAEQWLSVILSK